MELLKSPEAGKRPSKCKYHKRHTTGRFKPVPGSVVGSAQTQRKSWNDPTGYTHMHFPLGSLPTAARVAEVGAAGLWEMGISPALPG